jgi:hypothetical protein
MKPARIHGVPVPTASRPLLGLLVVALLGSGLPFGRMSHAQPVITRVEAISGQPFHARLQLQGIRFDVHATSRGSINSLTITPRGLTRRNDVIHDTIEGTVTAAEVADLNGDGSPELYIYVTSAGGGSQGRLVGYSANRRRSLSDIYLPELTDDKVHGLGYRGHDEFRVVEGWLVRTFPVYQAGDTQSKPTGGTRQLQYRLLPGEAGWVLRLQKSLEFR